MGKRNVAPQDKLGYYLLKGVNKAIRDYRMIVDGDRVAVAVSGGKDSLTLLHLLRLRQRFSADQYSLVAVHVAMFGAGGTPYSGADARPTLEALWGAEGQPHAFEAIQLDAQPDCFRCSFLRRKALFSAAQRLGCNKIAFGHHADDAAATTLLNLVFHGRVETLYPRREFFGGRFTIVRPLIYLPEKEIARCAKACAFPVQTGCCPRSTTSRRALAQTIVRQLEQEYPRVKINLFRAGLCPQGSTKTTTEG